MNWSMISAILILSLMGSAAALEMRNGVEMRPGEAAAESRFDRGFGEPWVGGDPPSLNSFSYGSSYRPRYWSWWDDPFSYYSHQGKTYRPYQYYYYHYPGDSWYPYTYRYYWYPYYSPYWWYW